MYADSYGHAIRSNGFQTVAFSVRADHFEYRALPVVSKTVMGHWPIESSNLSLSAIPCWRSGGLRLESRVTS
jgi:hypothetical protein